MTSPEIPKPALETSLANLAIGVFKLVAIAVLLCVALLVAGLMGDGTFRHEPGFVILGALGVLFAVVLVLGGFFVLASILRTLERIELRMVDFDGRREAIGG